MFKGCVPIIRCPKGNAAEMIAEVLIFKRKLIQFLSVLINEISET